MGLALLSHRCHHVLFVLVRPGYGCWTIATCLLVGRHYVAESIIQHTHTNHVHIHYRIVYSIRMRIGIAYNDKHTLYLTNTTSPLTSQLNPTWIVSFWCTNSSTTPARGSVGLFCRRFDLLRWLCWLFWQLNQVSAISSVGTFSGFYLI